MDDLLRKLGISGEALARYCGVSGRTVYRWRHGDCPVMVMDRLIQLAKAMDAIQAIRKA